MKYRLLTLLLATYVLLQGLSCQRQGIRLYTEQPFEKLSDYGFFEGDLKQLKPVSGLIPYDLNSALFSDYAQKQRFVYVPAGATIPYQDSAVLDFPVGSVLIKHFYYEAQPNSIQFIETRLLVHQKDGWEALPYVWNAEQTDALLQKAGTIRTLQHPTKANEEFQYVVPNKNQCKGCHNHNGTLMPIGPKVRNLNKSYSYSSGLSNQLAYWQQQSWFDTPLPAKMPQTVNWQDSSVDLHQRAMAYLDINCAHCHNDAGPASTSGLQLSYEQPLNADLGLWKSPVATGKGSGGHSFSIVPGQPEASILLYRMQSTDPGARMPELGRSLVHEEGVALIKEWIAAMPSD